MSKKLTATFAVLIVALMLTGMSYALWSKTLYIYGDVYTGDLDAEITFFFHNDYGIDPGYTKDVGSCTCTIDEVDPQKGYIIIENGYPSYSVHYSITIKNTGTVPWIMQNITVDGTSLPNNQWVQIDVDGDGDYDIEFYITDSLGEQVDPGDSIETSLDTHIMQGAEEGSFFEFTISFLLVQWNEYVPPS